MISDQALVAEAEKRLAAAHLTLDLGVIDHLLHEDYVIVQPGGRIETKADVLASYAGGTRHWDHAQVDQLDVKIYGSAARVIGLWTASGTNAGEHFDYQARFISIWIREAGEWRNLSYAAAEIAPETP